MNLIKECARLWARDARKVTRVAAVPLHGIEANADGVALHLELNQGEQLRLEVPRAQAGELRDWLRKTLEALDHWDKIARYKGESTHFVSSGRRQGKTEWLRHNWPDAEDIS